VQANVSTLPDPHAIFILLITVLALYLFTRDRIPLEASSLAILIVLIALFQLFPYARDGVPLEAPRFLEGFGNEALVTICALMILGKGMETTGALQPLASSLAKAWIAKPRLASLVTLLASAVLSGFVNNTPVVVMLLPMLVGVAVRNKIAPSSVLMPVGFATLLGGMATSIGTSTNLLVVQIAGDLGAQRFDMFDFTFPVVSIGLVGMVYLWLIAPRLLPARKVPLSDTAPRVFDAVFHINEDSTACGRTFAQVLALTNNAMRVERIERSEGLSVAKLPSVTIVAGDRLAVRDTPERLKEYEKQLGATLHGDPTSDDFTSTQADIAEQEHLAEIVVTRGSMLHKASLVGTRFAQRTGLLPLALHRARSDAGEEQHSHIGLIPLRAGDVVLVQGTQPQLDQLKRTANALVLDGTMNLPRTARSGLALAIMSGVVLAAAIGLMPISVSALIGVGLMLATRCLTWREVGASISAPVVMIVVTSLALGLALVETGGAQFIARGFVNLVSVFPTPIILSSLMLVMAVLTNVVSNNAAGVIGTPIAIEVARELGVSPEPFVLAVIFGANMSYATPFGYQTNLLVLSSGGYKFADFLRAGIPLTLIMWLGFSIILPLLYAL
jgi:di/tricarboxylate transporter